MTKNEYKIGNLIDTTAYYNIYEVQGSDKSYWVKEYRLQFRITKEYVMNEYKFHKLSHKLGASPQIIDIIGPYSTTHDEVKRMLIIYERYGDGTLTELYLSGVYQAQKKEIDKYLRGILDTLHENNISHNDLHSNNFIYKRVNINEYEFRIINFGLANLLGDREGKYVIEIPKTYHFINLSLPRI